VAYRRFEELPVWNDSIRLAGQIFKLTATGQLVRFSGLRNQIERAVVSISNNIAEGFEQGTNEELLTFLYIARGSAGEVRSMIQLLRHLDDAVEIAGGLSELLSGAEGVSRQLGRWIESIKNSGYQGERSRNDQVRRHESDVRRRDAFLAKLQDMQGRQPHPRGTDDLETGRTFDQT
jgi:four helix bundle protein